MASKLTEFLLARLAEDESDAQDYAEALEATYKPGATHVYGSWDRGNSPFDPSRVLAECEAKRQIVEYLDIYRATGDLDTPIGAALLKIGKMLALPHADHPDFRDEWRP